MSMRNSPSCECCDTEPPTCNVLLSSAANFHDNFTELAGSWTTGTNGGHGYWQTSGAPAAIATTVATDAGLPYRLIAKFNFAPSSGGTSFRLAAGGADANNYTFVEMRVILSGGEYYGQLLLGEVVAGSDNYLASAPYSTTDEMLIHGAASYEWFLAIEWDTEGALTGSHGDITSGFAGRTITKRSVTPAGGFAGLFVTALTGTLIMKQFFLEHGYDATDTPSCNRTFQSCAKGIPVDLTVKLADASPLVARWCSTTFCLGGVGDITPYCADILGEYATPHTGDGDDHCIYASEWVLIHTQVCNILGAGDVTVHFEVQISVDIIYTSDPTGATRKIRVSVSGRAQEIFQSCSLASFELVTTSPIETFTSYTNIPMVAAGLCGGDSLTCEIKV